MAPENKVWKFLDRLDSGQIVELIQLYWSDRQTDSRWRGNIFPAEEENLIHQYQDGTEWTLAAGGDGIERNGLFWRAHVTCETTRKKGMQWQPRLANGQGALSDKGKLWRRRFGLSDNDLPAQPKISETQLSWLSVDATRKLPQNLGAGSALSHLCDRGVGSWLCVTPSHLECVPQVDNMNRQRCLGITLIVSNSVIVKASACGHATGDSNEERVNTSCRRLWIISLTEEDAYRISLTIAGSTGEDDSGVAM